MRFEKFLSFFYPHSLFLFILFSASVASYGKGFSGYASATAASRNLFLSTPNIEQMTQHKSQLKQFMSSPAFQELSQAEKKKIRQLSRYTNRYINMSQYLDECEKRMDNLDNRGLISQIRAGISSVNPCNELAEGFLLSGAESQNISILANEVSKLDFQNTMRLTSLKNTGRAILKYQYQFGLISQLSNQEANRIAEKLCADQCNEKRKRGLVRYLKRVDLQIREALKKGLLTQYSPESAVNKINERIQSLDQALEDIGLEKKKQEASPEKVQQLYDVYSQKYIALASDTLGSLLLTDVMRDETGTLINLEDIKTVTRNRGRAPQGIIRPRHKSLQDSYQCTGARNRTQIIRTSPGENIEINSDSNLKNCTRQQSAEETFKQAVEEAATRAYTFNKNIQEENDLQEMIKKNPIAAGQSLVKHPNMIQHVCDEAIQIAQTDARNEKLFNYAETALNALDVASIGLMVTGGGALIGAPLKGVSGAARAGSVLLKASVLGGVGASAVRAVSGGVGVLAFNDQRQDLINSRIAEARTPEDIARIQSIEEQLGKSKASLIDAGLDALPFGVLNKLRKSGQLAQLGGNPSTLQGQLKAEENVIQLNQYLTGPENRAVMNRLSALSGEVGPEKVETLLIAVSQMDPVARTQVLTKLSKMDMSDSSVQKLINELEGVVNRCAA